MLSSYVVTYRSIIRLKSVEVLKRIILRVRFRFDIERKKYIIKTDTKSG